MGEKEQQREVKRVFEGCGDGKKIHDWVSKKKKQKHHKNAARMSLQLLREMLNRERFHWKQQDKFDSGYRVSGRRGCKI